MLKKSFVMFWIVGFLIFMSISDVKADLFSEICTNNPNATICSNQEGAGSGESSTGTTIRSLVENTVVNTQSQDGSGGNLVSGVFEFVEPSPVTISTWGGYYEKTLCFPQAGVYKLMPVNIPDYEFPNSFTRNSLKMYSSEMILPSNDPYSALCSSYYSTYRDYYSVAKLSIEGFRCNYYCCYEDCYVTCYATYVFYVKALVSEFYKMNGERIINVAHSKLGYQNSWADTLPDYIEIPSDSLCVKMRLKLMDYNYYANTVYSSIRPTICYYYGVTFSLVYPSIKYVKIAYVKQ